MKRTITVTMLFSIIALTTLVGCSSGETTISQDTAVQEATLEKGQLAVPAYQPQEFLARKAINEYMERMDTPDKLWYIYLMSESGAYIGYHISRTYPISIGVGMTSPERWVAVPDDGTIYKVKSVAPGIDGVFYNGVDPTLYYCFDAETDAMIMFTTEFLAYDKPLAIEVPQLRISAD